MTSYKNMSLIPLTTLLSRTVIKYNNKQYVIIQKLIVTTHPDSIRITCIQITLILKVNDLMTMILMLNQLIKAPAHPVYQKGKQLYILKLKKHLLHFLNKFQKIPHFTFRIKYRRKNLIFIFRKTRSYIIYTHIKNTLQFVLNFMQILLIRKSLINHNNNNNNWLRIFDRSEKLCDKEQQNESLTETLRYQRTCQDSLNRIRKESQEIIMNYPSLLTTQSYQLCAHQEDLHQSQKSQSFCQRINQRRCFKNHKEFLKVLNQDVQKSQQKPSRVVINKSQELK
eukprot:TRINITY_DN3626_c0_g1_i1.p1 TRINITY_DN3626_c0_g1~~TRINITY_DN3626_c0_g1_i1.p1  ORF type:complete len:282 (-),score=-17.04 TRINITY_DN3626_c0_g1_i1:700-1545(-)